MLKEFGGGLELTESWAWLNRKLGLTFLEIHELDQTKRYN